MEQLPPMPENLLYLLGAIYIGSIIVFVKSLINVILKSKNPVKTTKTTATVTKISSDHRLIKRSTDGTANSSQSYVLNVTFKDQNGRTRHSQIYHNTPVNEGDNIDIAYESNSPQNTQLYDPNHTAPPAPVSYGAMIFYGILVLVFTSIFSIFI